MAKRKFLHGWMSWIASGFTTVGVMTAFGWDFGAYKHGRIWLVWLLLIVGVCFDRQDAIKESATKGPRK